jgi:hypothetical protein
MTPGACRTVTDRTRERARPVDATSWLASFAIATMLGLGIALQRWYAYRGPDKPPSFWDARTIEPQLIPWYAWAAIAPLPMLLVDRSDGGHPPLRWHSRDHGRAIPRSAGSAHPTPRSSHLDTTSSHNSGASPRAPDLVGSQPIRATHESPRQSPRPDSPSSRRLHLGHCTSRWPASRGGSVEPHRRGLARSASVVARGLAIGLHDARRAVRRTHWCRTARWASRVDSDRRHPGLQHPAPVGPGSGRPRSRRKRS